jgi:hypothetical protein
LIADSSNSFNLAILPDRSFLTPARNCTCMYSCSTLNFCYISGGRSCSDVVTMLFMSRSHRAPIWLRLDWTVLPTWSFFPAESPKICWRFFCQHTRALDRAECWNTELTKLLPEPVWPVTGTGLTGGCRGAVKA